MARARLTYLSADDREFVHEQALRVLAEVGVGYNTPEAIDLLADAGAQVDRARLTARVPQELVESCLATCPSEVRLAGRDPRHDVVVGDGSLTFCADGTATYVLDDLTGRREDGSAEWLRRTMRLYDALPEVDYAWPTISARDLDPLTAGLEIEAISLANLTKHVQDEVRDPAHAAPLIEIFEAVAGGSLWDRPVFSTIDCTVAPLQHEREMTQATLAMVRAGVPLLALPMPLSGTTAPMTVLGTMIVSVAELLSAVVLFQLAQPGCGIISGMGAGVADMRSGLYLCATPECALMNVIGIEMSRFYGLPCTGSAITCDAKASNQQAGAEGMLTGAACALAGADTILAFGCSDGAQSLSFAKALLDCDSVGALRRLVREDPIDATRALLDDIAAVGIGGHYLGRRSTRQFHRGGEVWQPALWQRGSFEAYEGRPLVAEAAARAEELLRTHEVEPLPEDVAAEVDAVIERYARSVGAPDARVSWKGGDP
jgi:trimethylamine--corrinoid protein Co-methyltransferase